MAHSLTEIASFDTPITVPDGLDLPTRASDVDAIAQKLANRTKFLKAITDFAALTNVSNTFTAEQIIDFTASDVPMLATTKKASDDTTNSGSRWKLIIEAPTNGTQVLRIYAGCDLTAGALAITVNAWWHVPGSLNWRQDDTSKDSFALLVIGDVLTISRQTAGASAWSTWPTGLGDLSVGNTIGATVITGVTSVNSIGTINAAGNVNAFADCNVAGNVVVAGEVIYPGPTFLKVRQTLLTPIVQSSGLVADSDGGCNSPATGPSVSWEIKLPDAAQLTSIQVLYTAPTFTSGGGGFAIQSRTHSTYSGSPAAGTWSNVATASQASAFGTFVATITPGSPIVIDPLSQYRVIWTPNTPGPGNDQVQQMLMTWGDPGPRNF